MAALIYFGTTSSKGFFGNDNADVGLSTRWTPNAVGDSGGVVQSTAACRKGNLQEHETLVPSFT